MSYSANASSEFSCDVSVTEVVKDDQNPPEVHSKVWDSTQWFSLYTEKTKPKYRLGPDKFGDLKSEDFILKLDEKEVRRTFPALRTDANDIAYGFRQGNYLDYEAGDYVVISSRFVGNSIFFNSGSI